MMKITIGAEVHGPYTSVETLADRYQADGIDLPFSVVGEGEVEEWTGPMPTPPVQPPSLPEFIQALTAHLDQTAQVKHYDNRINCAVRAGYPGPFQAEGQAFATWMDECNAQAYQLQADVLAGHRDAPSTIAEFLAEFPAMVWPA